MAMHSNWNPWHGCIKCSDGCKYCYVYLQYAEDFRVSEKLLEEIGTPMIPEEEYARIVNQ